MMNFDTDCYGRRGAFHYIFSDVGEPVWLFVFFSTSFCYTSACPQYANVNQTPAAILRVLEVVGSGQAVAARYKLASSILYQWWAKLYGKSHKYAHILGRLPPASPPICSMMTLRVFTQLRSRYHTTKHPPLPIFMWYVIYMMQDINGLLIIQHISHEQVKAAEMSRLFLSLSHFRPDINIPQTHCLFFFF